MDFTVYDIALVPVIIAILAALKSYGIQARWLPTIAFILSELAAFIYISPDDHKKAALTGVVMALTAIGTHSGIKNTLDK